MHGLRERGAVEAGGAGLSEELGDERAVEALLADLGHLWINLGDLESPPGIVSRARSSRAQPCEPRRRCARAARGRRVEHHRGDLTAAEAGFLRALEVCDEGGLAVEGASVRERLLGRTIRARGGVDRAFDVYHRALRDALPSNDPATIAAAEQGLGWLRRCAGTTRARSAGTHV